MSPDNLEKAVSQPDVSLFAETNLVGQKVAGRWEIVELLGEGNMSTVYKAEDESTRKPVVLKLIHKSITSNVVNLKRLEQRAKALIALNHEHVSNFFDIYISPNQEYFLFCDFFASETLEEMLSKCGHISVERATRIFEQTADGLDYAHQQKILHRDIKPSNICLINDDYNVDDVKVVDFGIARLIAEESEETRSSQYITHTREIFGSVLYMSPEQCAGKKVDSRSDIYSLGCVMYEAINGKPPFVGKNVMETAYKHMNDSPAPLTAPSPSSRSFERYQAVVLKALKKNPQERYQSMAALKNDLEILLTASDAEWQANANTARRIKRHAGFDFSKRRIAWGLVVVGLGSCIVLWLLAVWAIAMLNSTESEDYPRFDNNMIWVVQDKRTKNQPEDFMAQREMLLQQIEALGQGKSKFSKEYEENLAKLCSLYMKAGNWPDAVTELNTLIEIRKKIGGPVNLAAAYADLATCYFWQNDFDQAKEMSINALKYANRANLKDMQAEDSALAILGDVYTRKGDNIKAKETYLKLYGFWDKMKQRYPGRYAMASAMLGDTYRRQGHLPEAEQFYRNALEWWQNYVGHQDVFVAKALYGLGLVLQGQHRWREAQERYSYALQLATNATGVRSALVGAIKKESSECLFHTDLLRWINQKVRPDEEAPKQQELPPLRLP